MDRPARGDELAGHAEQGLVRSSPFGHRLHAQDSESMAGPRGPAAPTARLAPHYAPVVVVLAWYRPWPSTTTVVRRRERVACESR